MNEILGAATIIMGVVMAATSLLKAQISNKKILPTINVLVGIFIGMAYAASFGDSIVLYGWAGLIAGFAAGGFYDLGSGVMKRKTMPAVDKDDQENNQ